MDVLVPNSVPASTAVTLNIYGVTNPSGGGLSVWTSSDPTQVSKSLGLKTATSIANLTVTPSSTAAGAEGVNDTISFTTSSKGALVGGWSKITVEGPPGTVFPGGCCGNGYYDVSVAGGAAATASPTFPEGLNVVDVLVPNSVPASTAVTLNIYGVTNPSGGGLSVWTSSDPTQVSKSLGLKTATSIANLTVTPSSTAAGAEGVNDTISFTTSSKGALVGGWSKITVEGPPGTVFPGGCCGNGYYDVSVAGGAAATASPTFPEGLNVVDVLVPNSVPASTVVTLNIYGVTNPSGGGLSVWTSSDPTQVSKSLGLKTATSIANLTVTPSSTAAGAEGVNDTISFTTSSKGALVGGWSKITVEGPPGTVFPQSNEYSVAVGGGAAVGTSWTVPAGRDVVDVLVPNSVSPGSTVTLSVAGVTNPGQGKQHFSVSTSSDWIAVSKSITFIGSTPALTSVSGASVVPSSASVGATAVTYKVTFTATSALPVNAGTPSNGGAIVLAAPFGTQFPHNSGDYAVADTTAGWSTTYVSDTESIANGGATVSINPLDAINAGDSITVVVSFVRNPEATGGSLSVSTTADPVPMSATLGLAAATSVSGASVVPSSASVGATAVTYKVTFTATSALPVNVGTPSNGGAIVLAAPFGTQFPHNYGDYAVADTTAGWSTTYVSDTESIANGGATVSINPLDAINAGDSITVVVSFVRNPEATGGSLSVSTTADPVPMSATLGLAVATSVSGASVVPLSASVGATAVTYKVTFTATSALPVNAGTPSNGGAIVLAAPFGTQFPHNSGDYAVADTTAGWSTTYVSDTESIANGGATVSINPLDAINAGDSITVVVSFVRNPEATGGSLSVSTTADPVPMSATLGLAAATSVSGASVVPSSASVGATAVTYKVTFTATSALPVNAGTPSNGGAIVLAAPFGTQFPHNSGDYAVADTTAGWSTTYVSDTESIANGGATVSINPLDAINAGDSITVVVSFVRNPEATGGSLSVSTTADPVPMSATLGLAAATSVSGASVVPSSASVGATAVTYKVTFTATSALPVNAGTPSNGGAIVLAAPLAPSSPTTTATTRSPTRPPGGRRPTSPTPSRSPTVGRRSASIRSTRSTPGTRSPWSSRSSATPRRPAAACRSPPRPTRSRCPRPSDWPRPLR